MAKRQPKMIVVGAAGLVGATTAQTLAIREIAPEVVLVDIAKEAAHGQALDISHAAAFTSGVTVRSGDYSDIEEDDIVVVTCGQPRRPDQTRLDLLKVNAKIIKDVTRQVMQQGKPVFMVVVANPVDIMTYVALKESKLPHERVMGTGTMLDTARLQTVLSEEYNVTPASIHALVLGEHGDSSFLALASATIGGVPLQDFPGFSEALATKLPDKIRQASQEIIEAKKTTYYGIANGVATLVKAMQQEKQTMLPVCSMTDGEYGLSGVVIGLPTLVNEGGAKILDDYPLSSSEQQALHDSARVLHRAIAELEASGV